MNDELECPDCGLGLDTDIRADGTIISDCHHCGWSSQPEDDEEAEE